MFKSSALLWLSLCLTFSFQLYAAEDCHVYFQTQPSGNYLKKNIEIEQDLKIGNAFVKNMIAKQVKDFSGEVFTGSTFDDAIDQVYRKIKGSTKEATAKGDELAKFGKELYPIYEAMLKKTPIKGTKEAPDLIAWEARRVAINKVKTIKYNLARKINDLEQFAKADYKVVSPEAMVFTKPNAEKLTHMKMKDYPKYVESYLEFLKNPNGTGAKLYNDIKGYNEVFSGWGILDIQDIRDITSYSIWPMYLKSHDIKHIHFSLTHPMALASMMNVTRSKNHLRYALVAGMYEGVDRVQYGHETALNKFFGTELSSSQMFKIKRNMDLEEAMLTIATATKADLKKIAAMADVDLDEGLFDGVADWVPKRIQGGIANGKALDGETFEEEINDMTEQFTKLLNKSEKIKKKLLENPGKILTKEEKEFMKLMNFQIDPEDPEIVIDGLRYKNDGRAHFDDYDADDADSVIGIGDL